MPIDPGPHDLDAMRVVMAPAGDALLRPVTPRFYEGLSDIGDFTGHVLVSRHSFDAAWSMWEMHPVGDELVYLLEGDVDFVLLQDGVEKALHVDVPGTYVIVPKGTWHTARPRKPTTMLFLTPGEGTENRERPPV